LTNAKGLAPLNAARHAQASGHKPIFEASWSYLHPKGQ
jgi:hypothetical protein